MGWVGVKTNPMDVKQPAKSGKEKVRIKLSITHVDYRRGWNKTPRIEIIHNGGCTRKDFAIAQSIAGNRDATCTSIAHMCPLATQYYLISRVARSKLQGRIVSETQLQKWANGLDLKTTATDIVVWKLTPLYIIRVQDTEHIAGFPAASVGFSTRDCPQWLRELLNEKMAIAWEI